MIKIRKEFKRPLSTGERLVEQYRPFTTTRTESVEKLMTFDAAERYVMQATVGVHFIANQAQYDHARKNAEQQLLAVIYAEVLDAIGAATSAAYAGDCAVVIDVLQKLRGEILEP